MRCLNFLEVLIIGNFLKTRFKKRGSSCYFLSSIGQKIKNITKTEQQKLFLFCILGFIFCGVSRAKADLHNKYNGFNLFLAHFLNKIIY